MSHTLTIRLDKDTAAWLEETAHRTGVPQGRIVRDQLVKARTDRTAKPFLRLSGVVKGGPRDVSSRKGFAKPR